MSKRLPKRCLRCGELFKGGGSYCPDHRTAVARGYDKAWRAKSEQAIQAWVAKHGWWCPGWRREGHPSEDLVLDHAVGVMCRSCNSSKGAVEDKAAHGGA